MAKKKVYYSFPTEMLQSKYRYEEIDIYPPDFVGLKTMLQYMVPGYFTQTECAIATCARLTFLCRSDGWELAGWVAYIGGWDVHTEEEAMNMSLKAGNTMPKRFATAFFDFHPDLYDTGW